MPPRPLPAKYHSKLEKRVGIILAGAAGKKINSAANLFCQAALLSGLWATQRNDYPVTVKSGHSVSEVILAPGEIGYTGISKPDILLLLFKEGLPVVRQQLKNMTEEDCVLVNAELLPVETRAKLIPIDFRQSGSFVTKKESWAIIALTRLLREMNIFPLEAFKNAMSARVEFAEENLRAIEQGEKMGEA